MPTITTRPLSPWFRLPLGVVGLSLAGWAFGNHDAFLDQPDLGGVFLFLACWLMVVALVYLAGSGRRVRISATGALLVLLSYALVGTASWLTLRKMAGIEYQSDIEWLDR